MAKVHMITLLVVDFEGYRDDDIEVVYSQLRHYPASQIIKHDVKYLDWDDSHPLNQKSTTAEEAVEIFNKL